MSANPAKPQEMQAGAQDPNGNLPLLIEKGEEDLLEYPPEEAAELMTIKEEKPSLAKTLGFEVSDGEMDGQSISKEMRERAIALTNGIRKSEPSPEGKEERESQKLEIGTAELILWHSASGVIMRNNNRDRLCKFIGKDLLAIVRISKMMKVMAENSEDPSEKKNGQSPIVSINPGTVEQIKDLEDGYYLVLKMNEGKFFVLGCKKTADAKLETIVSAYKEIKSAIGFFDKNAKMESGEELRGDTPITNIF